MKATVILKEYINTQGFEWKFEHIQDIYFLDESIEIEFIEDEEDVKVGIITSIKIPRKIIKSILIHEF